MKLPKNMIIVEDEMMAQRYLKDILGLLGVTKVRAFTNAKDTISSLKQEPCDMLLADINIKGSIDGIQMAREIVQNYDIPIIFITAYSDEETLEEALDISPFGYIVKPFSQSDVELQVRVSYKKFLDYKNSITNHKDSNIHTSVVNINEYLKFDLDTNTLYKNNNEIYLPHKQNQLVAELCKNINNIVSYDQLEYVLWADEIHASSALRTLIYGIRNTIPELNINAHSKLGYSIKSV